MKTSITTIGCGPLGLVSTAAGAADYGYGESPYGGAYFGASVGELYDREDGIPPLDSTVAMFRFGQQFSPYLAIEGRIGGLGGAQMHRNYPAFNTNDIAVSYGGGLEANVGAGASVNAEWAHLTNGDNIGYNYNANMLTFGVSWHPWWGF